MNEENPPGVGDFELMCFFKPGQRFSVDFSPRYNRATNDAALEAHITSTWAEKLKSNPRMFNGTKFRLHATKAIGDVDEANHSASQWELHMGVTDYKSFQGTNCATNWITLIQTKPEHISHPLGNGAVVELADGKVVLLQRSAHVGECPNTVVLPGGHPEPEEIGIRVMKDALDLKDSWPSKIPGIMHELEDSITREVVEETGIMRDSLTLEACLGVSRRMLNYRPAIFYLFKSSSTSAEVLKRYTEGKAVDEEESNGMFFLDPAELISKVIERDEVNMPGCHRGGILLYQKYRDAMEASKIKR